MKKFLLLIAALTVATSVSAQLVWKTESIFSLNGYVMSIGNIDFEITDYSVKGDTVIFKNYSVLADGAKEAAIILKKDQKGRKRPFLNGMLWQPIFYIKE